VTFAPLFRKNTLRDSWFLECYGQKRWHSFSWSRIRASFRGLSKMPEVCQLNKSSERVRVWHSNRTLWTNTQRHPETVQLQNPKTCGWRVGVALRLQWHRENNSTIGLNLDLWQPMVVVVVVMFVSALLALWYSLKIGSADASEAFEVGGWGGGTETLFLERVCPFACGSTLKRIWRRVALSFEERKLWFWCLFDGFESMIVVFLCHSQVWLTCRARLVLSSLQNTKEGRDRLVRQSHAFQTS